MKRLVVFSGAGMSAESGIKTFRGKDGLWEGHRIEDVATPEAWHRNQELVHEFYNQRRKALLNASPNAAHQTLAKLEKHFDVQIITQNVDDLHERGGSTRVLHLHGELMKCRSTKTGQVYDMKGPLLHVGDLCPNGGQLRPHIVWFGEEVPNYEIAEEIVSKADYFLVIGTSLQVYPAAYLVHVLPEKCKGFIVDPNAISINGFHLIQSSAVTGIKVFVDELFKIAHI
jgi:NAD-dependent deacetylase